MTSLRTMTSLQPSVGQQGPGDGEAAPRQFWVRVPGSTSNLGPGFDALGMAVDTFLEATWASSEGEALAVTRSGTLADAPWPPEDDLVVRVLGETFRDKRRSDPRITDPASGSAAGLEGRLHLHSEIPLGRGLGSSAAARIAGAVLGRLLSVGAAERRDVLADAAAREGHPDNAAPAVLGGLVASTLDETGAVTAIPLPLSMRIGWVLATPGVELATNRARTVLPDQISRAAAVRNTGRLTLLLPALGAGDGPLLAVAMEDELHVPYRLPLVPGGAEAVAAAREAGAWGVTLSGAGSGLLAAVPRGAEAEVGEAMVRAFQAHPDAQGGSWRALEPWNAGVQWGVGPLRPPGPERFATSRG